MVGLGLSGLMMLIELLSVHDCDRAVAEVAVSGHEPNFGIDDLSLPAVSAKLAHQFNDVIQAGYMSL